MGPERTSGGYSASQYCEEYMKNSRRKGKEGELELSKKLKEHGFECRRGQQYCGANGDADVIGLYRRLKTDITEAQDIELEY